jgi:hypothetical protein
MIRLVALYPRTWRDRYEEEFLALLSERPPDPLDRIDIVRGAIDARLHPQVQGAPVEPEPPVVRGPWPVRAGWLTLLGGVLWIATMIVAVNAPIVVDGGRPYRDAAAAAPLFFTAVVLLGVGMLAVVLELPAPARAARTAAFVSSLVGLLWALAPWLVMAAMVAFAGLLVVAVAAWRAGRWSSLELGILVAGVALWCGPILAYAVGVWVPLTQDPDTQFLVFGALVAAWVAVGVSLVRAPRRRISLDPPIA